MATENEESLRQALIEVEHLRQREAQHRENAESLLEGLQRLSLAQSQHDSLESVLSILVSVMEIDAVGILGIDRAGHLTLLAATGKEFSAPDGAPRGAIARAFAGKTILLNDSALAGFGFPAAQTGSAVLQPVSPVEDPAVLICLSTRRAAFGPLDKDKLGFFLPLVAHAIRLSSKLTELQQVVRELDTARAAAEEVARRDDLSGLANRKALEETFSRILGTPDASEACCAIIDLDDFKPINDTFGHDAGDAVLKAVGERLRAVIGARGTAARLGGDEFSAVVLGMANRQDCARIAEEICGIFAAPISFGGRDFQVRASIGVALFREAGDSMQEVVSAADKAMYSVKQTKETGYCIYDPSAQGKGISLFERQRLLDAIRGWEVRPFFQPKVHLKTGEIVGFEALARWVEPRGSIIMPDDFLPAVEDHGLQAEFTCSIARQVAAEMALWPTPPRGPLNVAINVPEATLATDGGLEEFRWILAEEGIGNRLTCEITEDVFIARSNDRIRRSITALRDVGVRISLDDFGTGYGSFRHLQELKVDELKIDTQIVAGIGRERSAEIIIEGFLVIATGLGIEVVAEGIETEAQAKFLIELGCNEGQGFLFGAPMNGLDVRRILGGVDPRETETLTA